LGRDTADQAPRYRRRERDGFRPCPCLAGRLLHTLKARAGIARCPRIACRLRPPSGSGPTRPDGHWLRWADEQADYDADLGATPDALEDHRFVRAWTEGVEMIEEPAVAYASRARAKEREESGTEAKWSTPSIRNHVGTIGICRSSWRRESCHPSDLPVFHCLHC
jgi:hypothetical protein